MRGIFRLLTFTNKNNFIKHLESQAIDHIYLTHADITSFFKLFLLHTAVALSSQIKSSNEDAFCMRIIMNYWMKQLCYSKLLSQVGTSVWSDDCWSVESLHMCCFVCVSVPECAVCLVVRTGFGALGACSPARPPAAGDWSVLWHHSLTPRQPAPTSRIPSLGESSRPTRSCLFFHLSGLSEVHIWTQIPT